MGICPRTSARLLGHLAVVLALAAVLTAAARAEPDDK
jgi:hypothetical protein